MSILKLQLSCFLLLIAFICSTQQFQRSTPLSRSREFELGHSIGSLETETLDDSHSLGGPPAVTSEETAKALVVVEQSGSQCYGPNSTLLDVFPGPEQCAENEPTRNNGALVVYSVCLNHDTMYSYYSYGYILGGTQSIHRSVGSRDKNFQQPTKMWNYKYPAKYAVAHIKKVFNKLLGRKAKDYYFASGTSKFTAGYYISIGHFFGKADSYTAEGQRSTFLYINTAPQWQIINGGNWRKLEDDIRNYADGKKKSLFVYTGQYGTLNLPGDGGTEVEMYLDPRAVDPNPKRTSGDLLPIPKFFWRIVVDNEKDAAVAIIQLNNPFVNETQLTNEDKLCPDVTDKITWLTELKKDPTLRKDPSVGYTYSCEVAELEKVVPFLPSLGPGINLLT